MIRKIIDFLSNKSPCSVCKIEINTDNINHLQYVEELIPSIPPSMTIIVHHKRELYCDDCITKKLIILISQNFKTRKICEKIYRVEL